MKNILELDKYIAKYIQGGFGGLEMGVLEFEAKRLKAGDVYIEIGVDEGRSARVAHEYLDPEVFRLFIDIHDPTETPGLNRAQFMEQEKMVGLNINGFYVHGDADNFSEFLFMGARAEPFVDLLFIDGHHDYESVKDNTLAWERFVLKGGVILFHDYDHPETKKWLDEHYQTNKEVIGGKIVRVRK